jgi:hypothetical protein
MVLCPLPSKKQLCACSVFRMNATVLKGSCLVALEIENVAVLAIGKHQGLQKVRQSC